MADLRVGASKIGKVNPKADEWYDFSDDPWKLVSSGKSQVAVGIKGALNKDLVAKLTALGCKVEANRILVPEEKLKTVKTTLGR